MSARHAEFLETMKRFFEGDLDAAGVESRLGKSASGTARLALYGALVRRQRVGLLDHFFRAARVAAETHARGTWADLLAEYLRSHRPDHWEPNRFAAPMVAFLEQRAADGGLPSFVFELADYAWIRYAASLAPHGDVVTLGADVVVREYDHDVATYARDVEAAGAPPRDVPERATTILLVCRSRVSGKLETIRPSVAALLALGEHTTRIATRALPPGITADDVEAESRALVTLGVLPGTVLAAT